MGVYRTEKKFTNLLSSVAVAGFQKFKKLNQADHKKKLPIRIYNVNRKSRNRYKNNQHRINKLSHLRKNKIGTAEIIVPIQDAKCDPFYQMYAQMQVQILKLLFAK